MAHSIPRTVRVKTAPLTPQLIPIIPHGQHHQSPPCAIFPSVLPIPFSQKAAKHIPFRPEKRQERRHFQ
ncbi:hypothetical protein ACMZ4Y_09655 [Prevotella histicola]